MPAVPNADSLFLPILEAEDERPHLRFESELAKRGRAIVAGVDEAGRGPMAGPVVAAAVILHRDRIPDGIDDSKRLEPELRAELFELLADQALVSWCAIDAPTIDRINIRQASLLAMERAVAALPAVPQAVLVDGRDVPLAFRENGHAVVKGDAISKSIAAASVVAKVVRDRIMERADHDYPGYGFASHKGYCTSLHREALARLGPCPLHRQSFAPVANKVAQEQGCVADRLLFALDTLDEEVSSASP
jgi:ribonuclease HII